MVFLFPVINISENVSMQDNPDAVLTDWRAKLFPGEYLASGWTLSEPRTTLQEGSAEDEVPDLDAPGQFFAD